MSKIQVPLLTATIRRDANTITPVTVPAYELTMLRQQFGKENVTEGAAVGFVDIDPAGEYERLSAKYGQAKVAKVYGDDEGERLAELVVKAATKSDEAKASKAKKAADITAE